MVIIMQNAKWIWAEDKKNNDYVQFRHGVSLNQTPKQAYIKISSDNFEKTDRVTIGYDTNPIAQQNLCKALGIKNEQDNIQLLKALGCEYIGVNQYTKVLLYTKKFQIDKEMRTLEV